MAQNNGLICIVEDDASVRRALGRIVQSLGFKVQLFASGRECLDRPFIDRAQCLIVDVTMPDMNGHELHALLQASGRAIPTVFISGDHTQKNIDWGKSTASVTYLSKPCDAKMLRDAIDEMVASRNADT